MATLPGYDDLVRLASERRLERKSSSWSRPSVGPVTGVEGSHEHRNQVRNFVAARLLLVARYGQGTAVAEHFGKRWLRQFKPQSDRSKFLAGHDARCKRCSRDAGGGLAIIQARSNVGKSTVRQAKALPRCVCGSHIAAKGLAAGSQLGFDRMPSRSC